MKTKTNCKAGTSYDVRLSANHNETLARDCGKNLRVKTGLRAGSEAKANLKALYIAEKMY